MSNEFFNPSGQPGNRSNLTSAVIRNEFALIQSGFDKWPALSGHANQVLAVNSNGTGITTLATPSIITALGLGTAAFASLPISPANGGTGVANNAASTWTISGNFATTITVTATTSITLPTTGTLATLAGAETLANKTLTTPTINGGTIANATSSSPTISGTADVTGRVKSASQNVAAASIDCSTGNYFDKTVSGNITFSFDNAPASPALFMFTLEVTHTSGTITWPGSVRWPDDTPPTLSTGKTHLFTFVTRNGGTRWRGAVLRNYTT